MRRFAAFALIVMSIAGCGDDRPPAPSAAENEQLNDAAVMLDDLAANEAATPR